MQKTFGVIGYPLGHTMSPFIHKALFAIRGFDADYITRQIAPEELTGQIDFLKSLDGFNITIPHKCSIIPFLDLIDDTAAQYGAVNTVCRENGKTIGYNTDAYGFLSGLAMAGIKPQGRVLVYGYGGVARTIAYECIRHGCAVSIGTRNGAATRAITLQRELVDKLGYYAGIIEIGNVTRPYDLFINATPVGMHPNTGESPLPKEQIDLFSAVYDTIYNPQETALLKMAEDHGIKHGGGLSMLVCQAQMAQTIWYGASFTKEETEKVIADTAKELAEVFGRA